MAEGFSPWVSPMAAEVPPPRELNVGGMTSHPHDCSEYTATNMANGSGSPVGVAQQSALREKEFQMLGEIFGVDGIIVLIVVLALLFGGAAIPKLARNLGSAKNQFTTGLEEGKISSAVSSAGSPGEPVAPAEVLTPAPPHS
jgi:mttA/Hcf106 family